MGTKKNEAELEDGAWVDGRYFRRDAPLKSMRGNANVP
jgi:hypothetical protein